MFSLKSLSSPKTRPPLLIQIPLYTNPMIGGWPFPFLFRMFNPTKFVDINLQIVLFMSWVWNNQNHGYSTPCAFLVNTPISQNMLWGEIHPPSWIGLKFRSIIIFLRNISFINAMDDTLDIYSSKNIIIFISNACWYVKKCYTCKQIKNILYN